MERELLLFRLMNVGCDWTIDELDQLSAFHGHDVT